MEWISVKKELPDKYKRVIVTNGKDVCLHYKQSGWNQEGFEGDDLYPIGDYKSPDGKWAECCQIDEGTITHWMPLPEAPKG